MESQFCTVEEALEELRAAPLQQHSVDLRCPQGVH